jgi:prevent-host-death family protein
MVKRASAAEAKAQLSALMAEVAHGGSRFLIERRGKAMAALVSARDLDRLEREHAVSLRPRGALGMVGSWKEVPDEEMDCLVSGVYSLREPEVGPRAEVRV